MHKIHIFILFLTHMTHPCMHMLFEYLVILHVSKISGFTTLYWHKTQTQRQGTQDLIDHNTSQPRPQKLAQDQTMFTHLFHLYYTGLYHIRMHVFQPYYSHTWHTKWQVKTSKKSRMVKPLSTSIHMHAPSLISCVLYTAFKVKIRDYILV